MTSHVTQRTAVNGAVMTVPGVFSKGYQAPPSRRSLAAQVIAMLAMFPGRPDPGAASCALSPIR